MRPRAARLDTRRVGPACGATARDGTGWNTPRRAAADLSAAIDHVRNQHPSFLPPAVLGWSLGSLVAQLHAQGDPSAISALVLYGDPRDPDKPGRTGVGPAASRPPDAAPNTAAAAASDFISPAVIDRAAIDAFVQQAMASDPVRADWRAMDEFASRCSATDDRRREALPQRGIRMRIDRRPEASVPHRMSSELRRRTLLAWSLVTAAAACGRRTDGAALEVGDDCQIAREAERRGDYPTARHAYATCLSRVPGFVDSHIAYQRILELEDGIESARRTYAQLAHENPGMVTSFAQARILARPERTAALERLVSAHPDFAPLYFELSLDHAERTLGLQSLAAKSREKLYLESFLMRASGPEFVRHFADYAFAEQWVRDAQARLAKLDGVAALGPTGPLKMTATPSSAGWMVHFAAAEITKSIEYRVEGGEWRLLDNYFSTPLTRTPVQISARYQDVGGAMQGPFDYVLDPRAELVAFGKGVLVKMPAIWGAFGDDSNAGYFYFTTLMVYRCALARVEYGLGTSEPDRDYPMPACDPLDPMAIPSDTLPYIAVDGALPFVSMRLTFADGQVTETSRIDRKPMK